MAFKLKNKRIKKIVGELRKASKMHAGQADRLESMSPMKGKLKPCQKAAAKRKFKVYPSAYANMWASRHKC